MLQANSFWDIGSLRQSGHDLNTLFKNKSVETRAGIDLTIYSQIYFQSHYSH